MAIDEMFHGGSASTSPNMGQKHTMWVAICEQLRSYVDPIEFQTWIAPLSAKHQNEYELVIAVPNVVYYRGILDRYWDKLEQAKSTLNLQDVLIRFEVEGQEDIEKSPASEKVESTQDDFGPEDGQVVVSRALSDRSNNLNPTYTFESFVRGDSNQFAHATCMAVADAPGQAYNPLFIYGSTGLGKTHLLHAVGHRLLQTNPNPEIIYISSERFMNEMIYCIRFNKMWDFRRKYRNCDLFLVDDIQFISGKDRTQEEFFHTFNSLYEAKKQIVITSDMFPQDIPDIEDRLRNRFQWGLIADIQPPSVEHRIAILINKAASLGIQLQDDVAFYIASHAKRNIRELEGALHRIVAFSALHGRRIDIQLAAESFQNVIGEAPKRLTVETIQKVVADHFKIRVTDLKSKKRQRALTVPRQIAMYLSRVRTNASFPEIGSRFGGKDHTTVMHAVKKVELERLSDLDLRTSIEALERKIEQHS